MVHVYTVGQAAGYGRLWWEAASTKERGCIISKQKFGLSHHMCTHKGEEGLTYPTVHTFEAEHPTVGILQMRRDAYSTVYTQGRGRADLSHCVHFESPHPSVAILQTRREGPRWQSGNTLASHLRDRGSIPDTASSGKAGSCLPLVGSLQYRTLTNCMYWFPLPFQLPVLI